MTGCCFMQRDPEYFPEPDRFVPERFLEVRSTEKNGAYVYVPFSAGRWTMHRLLYCVFRWNVSKYFQGPVIALDRSSPCTRWRPPSPKCCVATSFVLRTRTRDPRWLQSWFWNLKTECYWMSSGERLPDSIWAQFYYVLLFISITMQLSPFRRSTPSIPRLASKSLYNLLPATPSNMCYTILQ